MAEKKKVDLRQSMKNTFGVRPFEVDLPGLKGTLPFAPGKAIKNPTDILPESVLAEELRVQNEPVDIPASARTAPKLPPLVQIEDLPEERQAELLEAIKEAQKPRTPVTPTFAQPPQQPFMPRGPGIAEAKRMADRAAQVAEERMKQADKPDEKPEESPAEPAPNTEKVTVINCVHCGWPVGTSEPTEPTPKDKQVFVAALLGQKRFTKEYPLLGGQLRVTFRTLTVEENDLVIKQLMKDWNDGKISGPAHSVVEATKYQLALALGAIETNVGQSTIPALEDYDFDTPKEGTILPDVVAYVQKMAMPSEPIRRIVSKAYGHFIDTVTKLEAMAEHSDFWQATGV